MGRDRGDDWDFAHMAEYFQRIEHSRLVISRQRSPRSSTGVLPNAVECGYRDEQPNQPEPDGFCVTMVTRRRGARWNCADAYLKPALRPQPHMSTVIRGDPHPPSVCRSARRRQI
jgi:choline dehydrogenase